MDTYRAARLARKRRTRWWREHIVFAYIFLLTVFLVGWAAFGYLDRELPRWLTAIGVTPSGIKLIIGTISCGVGAWGVSKMRSYGAVVTAMYVLCLLSGLLTIAKAFSLL